VIVVVALALAAMIIAARGGRRRRVRRARERLGSLLPQLAADLARAVRGGATLPTALEEAAQAASGPIKEQLDSVLGSIQRGRTTDQALQAWADRSPVVAVELLVRSCRFGTQHGGDLAAALDGVAAALLDELELADETRALTAQARGTAAVLVALPPLGAAVFVVVDPRVGHTLLFTAGGTVCLGIGLALDAAGAGVARALVRSALR